MARSVQHHFDDPLHVPIRIFEAPDVHAEAPGKRGTHLLRVEVFPLDFAALEYVIGEGLENGLLTKLEAQTLHSAQQTPLLVTDSSQSFR
jgi:hypothetical protein